MDILIACVVTAVVFLGLDAIWLKTFIGPFFRKRIGHLMREDPLMGVAGGFYLIYALGIVWFAVIPALNAGEVAPAVINGAFLGLLGYGTYEATSMSIMKDWKMEMLVVDILWGMAVSAVAAAAGFYAVGFFS